MAVIIEYTKMVGNSPLWEIIVGVGFVVLFFAVSLVYHAKKATDRADRLLYPTDGEVMKASAEKLDWWLENLPEAKTDDELKIIMMIADCLFDLTCQEATNRASRAVNKASELHAATRYETTAKCEAEMIDN